MHGFGGDLNNWLFNQEALADQSIVYSLDLPGHGQSSKDVGDADISSFSRVLEGFMSAESIDKAHLVGHSLGGAIVLALATNCKDKVLSLTLIGSAGLGDEINAEYIDGFITSRKRKEIKPHLEKLFNDSSLLSRELVEEVLMFKRVDGVPEALQKIAESFFPAGKQAENMRDQIASLDIPAQVIWGENDQIIPAAHAEGLPGAHIIENAGHMVLMEAFSEVNKLI